MADDEELIHVGLIDGIAGKGRSVPIHPHDRGGRDHREPRQPKRPRDYFHTLAKAAEESNKRLTEKHSLTRFCVYLKGEHVLIDVIRLDSHGKIISTVTKDITNDDFDHWIEDISGNEGLLLDEQA